MLKVVLLDFDNTIYDDVGAIRRVFIRLRSEYRFFKSIPLDELISRFYYSDYRMQDMLRNENKSASEVNLARTDMFLQNVGLPLKMEMVMEIHRRIRELHMNFGKPVPGALKFLKKLKEKYQDQISENTYISLFLHTITVSLSLNLKYSKLLWTGLVHLPMKP